MLVCNLQLTRLNVHKLKWVSGMKLIRFIIVVLSLTASGQSLALFMPAGFQINVDTATGLIDSDC